MLFCYDECSKYIMIKRVSMNEFVPDINETNCIVLSKYRP